jgi:hypothetical protein
VFQCVHSGIFFDGASISHFKELALVSGISTHADLRLAQPAVRDAKQQINRLTVLWKDHCSKTARKCWLLDFIGKPVGDFAA